MSKSAIVSSSSVGVALSCWPECPHHGISVKGFASRTIGSLGCSFAAFLAAADGPTLDTDPVMRMLPPSGQCLQVQC
jgi:hypothetical protein